MRRGGCSSHTAPAAKEKQRRERMKDLYSTLANLLHLKPHEKKSLPEFLDRATATLKQRKEGVERLKVRKDELEKEVKNNKPRLQMVRVTESEDLTLEVNLIFEASNKKLVPILQVLRIIQQCGAEIMSSTFNTSGDCMYCVIHAQAFQARLGFDIKLIESQLMELLY